MAIPSRYSIAKKLNSMAGLSAYENGGKGSGNYGHKGRPGMVGGSGDGMGAIDVEATRELRERLERLGESFRQSPGMQVLIEKDRTGEVKDYSSGEDKYHIDVEDYTQSTTELEKLFPEGSTFYDEEGNEMTVQRGSNGLQGVSKDGRRVTAIPGDMLDSTAQYMASEGGANNPGKRLGAWGEIVHKMYELGMPRMAGEEVMRYAGAEHRFASTKARRKENLKSVQSYADTARGALHSYATGNGVVSERGVSPTAKKCARAISDQIKYGRLCAEDIAREYEDKD